MSEPQNLSEILDLDELAAVESFLSPEEIEKLNRDLAEIARKRRMVLPDDRPMA